MATASPPHHPADVSPTSPTSPTSPVASTNNASSRPLSNNAQPPTQGDSSATATSSSHQRRADALGCAVRATSSAGNSISSRSHASGVGGHGNGSANGIAGMMEGTVKDFLLPESTSRPIRTLPTWVQRREQDEEDIVRVPSPVHRRPPTHSAHDTQRENIPVTPTQPNASRWKGFVEVSKYPPNTSQSEKGGNDWLAEHPDLNTPWLAPRANAQDPESAGEASADDRMELFRNFGKEKRRVWYKRIHIMLLNSPIIPLFLRSIIWTLSLVALSLAGSIFHLSRKYHVEQKASTIMAIVVDAIALVYTIYITYDEYSGKPLGLRSPTVKMRLIMFDLLFIVFDSANLSLAFDSLFDVRWSCRTLDFAEDESRGGSSPAIDPICDRQRALAAFLFLALCAWVSTFTVSVFRVVERVSSRPK